MHWQTYFRLCGEAYKWEARSWPTWLLNRAEHALMSSSVRAELTACEDCRHGNCHPRRFDLALVPQSIHNGLSLMPPSSQPRIFISYARKDGASLAQRLQSDLTKDGFDVWLDTQRLTGGVSWTVEIEREVDRRPVMLAILTPGSYESSACRSEQLRSLDKGNRLIPVLGAKRSERACISMTGNTATSLVELTTECSSCLAEVRGQRIDLYGYPDEHSRPLRPLPRSKLVRRP